MFHISVLRSDSGEKYVCALHYCTGMGEKLACQAAAKGYLILHLSQVQLQFLQSFQELVSV